MCSAVSRDANSVVGVPAVRHIIARRYATWQRGLVDEERTAQCFDRRHALRGE